MSTKDELMCLYLFIFWTCLDLLCKLEIVNEIMFSHVKFINGLKDKKKYPFLLFFHFSIPEFVTVQKKKKKNLLSLDLFGGECALLMDVQRLWPQCAVSAFRGGWSWGLAADFEGHPRWLGITAQWHWLGNKKAPFNDCVHVYTGVATDNDSHLDGLAEAAHSSTFWRRYQVDEGWNFSQRSHTLATGLLGCRHLSVYHPHYTVITKSITGMG